jgi:hypothetical protein
MLKTLYIPLDTTINNTVACEKLVKRGDTLILTIKVFSNGVLANLTGQSIDLILKKSDGTLLEYTIDQTNISSGIITAMPSQQSTLVDGIVSGELQIYAGETLTSTNTFTFEVQFSLADDVLEISKNDIKVLNDLRVLISQGQIEINKYNDCIIAIGNTVEAIEALANIKSYIDTNLVALESENAEAVVNINALKTENDKAPGLTINLKTQNDNAASNITALTTKNAEAVTNKNNLENSNTVASATKSALDISNTNATNTKNSLDTLNITATNTKNALNSTNATAQELKNELDTFVTEHPDVNNLVETVADHTTQLSEKANQTDLEVANQVIKTKADIDYVNTKTQANNLSYKESYATLSALQTAYPSGDSYNHVVLVDNYIYTWINSAWTSTQVQANGTGIANNTITTPKLANGAVTSNKIDANSNKDLLTANVLTGKYISGGTIKESPTYTINALYNCTLAIDISNYVLGDKITFMCPSSLNANILFAYKSDGTLAKNAWITNVTGGTITGITWNAITQIATMDVKAFCEAYLAQYVSFNFLASQSNFITYSVLSKSLDWLNILYSQMPSEVSGVINDYNLIPTINLPDTIVCMVNKEFNIYNNGIIADNKIESKFIIRWSYTGSNFTYLDDGFRITPTTTGSFTLTLQLCRQDTMGQLIVVYTKTFTVNVVANSAISTSYNVMFVGDSRTNNNTIVQTVKNDIPALNMIGTRGNTGAMHEGRNGWKAQDYCQSPNTYGLVNPFYNVNNPVAIDTTTDSNSALTSYFDFSYYCTNNNISKIDAVNILLGVNDNFSREAIRYIMTIVESIHAFDSAIKITIMHEYVSPKSNYPSLYSYTRWYQFRFYQRLYAQFANRENEKIYLLPTNAVVDGKYDFNYADTPISNRVTLTEKRCTDAVHLIDLAYPKLSDVWETYFKYSLI